MVALPVYSTYTWTETETGLFPINLTTRTITGGNLSVGVTSFPTTTWTTYTTTGVVAVPVEVETVVVSPVTSVQSVVSCPPLVPVAPVTCTTEYVTQIGYVTEAGVVVVMSPSQVEGLVTSQSVTSLPTTVTSTLLTTYAYTVNETWETTTHTLTWSNSSEMANPNLPPLQLPFEAWWLWVTANLPTVLVVFGGGGRSRFHTWTEGPRPTHSPTATRCTSLLRQVRNSEPSIVRVLWELRKQLKSSEVSEVG